MSNDAPDIQPAPLQPSPSSLAPSATPEASASPGKQWLTQIISGSGPAGEGGILSQLTSNPLFSAGFALAGLGVVARYSLQGLSTLASLARRRLLVSVEITGHDKAYSPLLKWMTAHQQAALSPTSTTNSTLTSRIYRALIPGSHELQARTTESVLPNGKTTAHFTLVPGPGKHLLRYKNAFIGVHRNREGSMPNIQTGEPFETMTLTTLYSQRHIFASIFLEASELAQAATEGRTMLFVPRMTTWEQFGDPKRKRPLESVVLATGVKERIVADIQDFLSARQWYLDRGIPYRRGYLLWGPPGTGKSSFIEALAGHLDFNIAMLTLSERGMTDDRLNVLLNKVPARTMVLLEDADAAFVNRRQVDGEGYSGGTVTFSGLLNALDGVVSAEERIIFLTTNHVERMDAAVVRPGRVDMTVRLGEADEWQVRKMWERFYGEGDEPVGEFTADADAQVGGQADIGQDKLARSKNTLQEEFVTALKERDMLGKVSTAQLQGLFVMCKDDPNDAIKKIEGLSADMEVAQRAVMG